MISIELTTGQKLQIAFIAMVLLFAGFMVWRSGRPTLDTAVNAWSEDRQVGVSPRDRISATNPANPAAMKRYYVFACVDGRLRITQFPNDASARTLLAFEPNAFQMQKDPNSRATAFNFFIDPQARVKDITDPYKRALALAAYSSAAGKMLGLMDKIGLTADQITKVTEAHNAMMDNITLIDKKAEMGTLHEKSFNLIMAALEQYKSAPGLAGTGQPAYNAKKADAARKVIELGTKYIQEVDDEKVTVIKKFMSEMDTILTADEKTRLADNGHQYEQTQLARAGGGRSPIRGAPNVPTSGSRRGAGGGGGGGGGAGGPGAVGGARRGAPSIPGVATAPGG